MAISPTPEATPKFKDADAPSGSSARPRTLTIGVVLLVALATVGACRQFTGPYTWHEPREVASAEWWLNPLDWNVDAGLPDIVGTINAVEVIASRVFVAGDAGLLAYSEDEGRSWTQLPYSPETQKFGAGPTTSATASLAPHGLNPVHFFVATVYADQGGSPAPGAQAPVQQPQAAPQPATGNDVTVNTSTLEFGRVAVGSTTPQAPLLLQFRNRTYKPLMTGTPVIATGRESFTITGTTCGSALGQMLPAELCTVFVVFSPNQTGAVDGQLIFAAQTVRLSGEGVIAADKPAAPVPPGPNPNNQLAPSLRAFGPCSATRCVLLTSAGSQLSYVSTDGGLVWKGEALQAGIEQLLDESTHKAAIAKLNLLSTPVRDAVEDQARARVWAVLSNGEFLRLDNDNVSIPVTRSTAATLHGRQSSDVLQPYGRFPAPWYLLLLFSCGLVLVVERRNAVAAPTSDDADTPAPSQTVPEDPTESGGETASSDRADPVAIRVPPTRHEQPAIGDQGTADKPLAPGEPDALGLGIIATGLAFFFRNQKTKPPLVLAINGRWGSGKSSLMNLLRSRLEDYGACPVWFNAWHHQQEDQLLAALLEAVRAQSIPPLSKWAGWSLRSRLAWKRLQQSWIQLAMVLGAIVLLWRVEIDLQKSDLSIGIAASRMLSWATDVAPEQAAERSATLLDAARQMREAAAKAAAPIAKDLNDRADRLVEDATRPAGSVTVVARLANLFQGTSVLALIATLVAAFKTASKGLRAFATNPASLLAADSGATNRKDLEAQASFRQRFASEFGDVTSVLGPNRRMTILIDDLDRCRPEKVREVLEAVNFLCSSGQCFIVLGMAREIVEHCVGLSFRRVVDTMPWEAFDLSAAEIDRFVAKARGSANAAVSDVRANLTAKRLAFARLFLDKLVQIEVAIPQPTPLQKLKLFETDEERRTKLVAETRVGEWLERVRRATRLIVPIAQSAVVLMVVIGGGIQLGRIVEPIAERWLFEKPPPPSATPGAASTAAPAPSPNVPAPVQTAQVAPQILPSATAAPNGWLAAWPFSVVVLFGLAAIAVGLRRLPHQTVRDAKPFSNALAVWHPLVMTDGARNTPRTARRFQNRVRYLAMRQRALVIGAPVAPVERWLRRMLDAPSPKPDQLLELPEGVNVLSAFDRDVAQIADWLTRGAEGQSGLATVKQSATGPEVTVKGDPIGEKELCALATGQVKIPEPVLVALAAIDELAPEWIDDPAIFSAVLTDAKSVTTDAAKLAALSEAIERHSKYWNNWQNLMHYRRAYLRLCSELDGVKSVAGVTAPRKNAR